MRIEKPWEKEGIDKIEWMKRKAKEFWRKKIKEDPIFAEQLKNGVKFEIVITDDDRRKREVEFKDGDSTIQDQSG